MLQFNASVSGGEVANALMDDEEETAEFLLQLASQIRVTKNNNFKNTVCEFMTSEDLISIVELGKWLVSFGDEINA